MTAGIEWTTLLDFPLVQTHRLGTALLTTYDAPDPRFVVEHLLPSLLGVESSADADEAERGFYLEKLREKLRPLRGRIAIVSGKAQREDSPHPWIWHLVWSFVVGARRKAVQHAKVWIFEWIGNDDDTKDQLEIIVSSANLTGDALRGQVQAWWRAIVPLRERS